MDLWIEPDAIRTKEFPAAQKPKKPVQQAAQIRTLLNSDGLAPNVSFIFTMMLMVIGSLTKEGCFCVLALLIPRRISLMYGDISEGDISDGFPKIL